jgi:hypothetical protein
MMLFCCREVSAGISALYAKLLVVLGIAFLIAEVLSNKVPQNVTQVNKFAEDKRQLQSRISN